MIKGEVRHVIVDSNVDNIRGKRVLTLGNINIFETFSCVYSQLMYPLGKMNRFAML